MRNLCIGILAISVTCLGAAFISMTAPKVFQMLLSGLFGISVGLFLIKRNVI